MRFIKTKNHFVPQMYLKNWAGSDSHVFRYRLLVPHVRVPIWQRKHISQVAYRGHLYTRARGAFDCDETERWLDANFEAPAQLPIAKAISGLRMTSRDWHHLVRFLAVQDLRTPARMTWLLQTMGADMQTQLEMSLRRSVAALEQAGDLGVELPLYVSRLDADFPVRVTMNRDGTGETGRIESEVVLGRSFWLAAIRHLMSGAAEVLHKHRWTILNAPTGCRWVTSDNPVMRINFLQNGQWNLSGGWDTRGAAIIMPISAQHLVYTKIGSRVPPRGTVVPPIVARRMQYSLAANAHREIYAAEPSDHVVLARPRVVDKAACECEQQQWQNWHREQAEAERRLESRGCRRKEDGAGGE